MSSLRLGTVGLVLPGMEAMVTGRLLGMRRWHWVGVVLVLAGLWPLRMSAGAEGAAVKSVTLLQTTAAWNGAAYEAYPAGKPELSVLRMTIPAHTTLPWHEHPMPNAGYIVSGEITVEEPGGAKRSYTAGQVLPETVNTVHRGVTGDQPAVLIVFYAGVKDMPLARQAR